MGSRSGWFFFWAWITAFALAATPLAATHEIHQAVGLSGKGKPDPHLMLPLDPGDVPSIDGGYGDGLNEAVNLGTEASPNWARRYTLPHSGSGGFIVYNPVLDVTPFEAIVFKVKGAAGGERFDVRVLDGTPTEKRYAIDAILSSPGVTTSFKRAIILLSDLQAAGLDLTKFKELTLESTASASIVVTVDDLHLEKPTPS